MTDVQRREFENLRLIAEAGTGNMDPATNVTAAILLVAGELRELHILGTEIRSLLESEATG